MTASSSPRSQPGFVPLFGVTEYDDIKSPIDRRSEVYRHQVQLLVPDPHPPTPLVNLPNILTFLRVVLVPVMAALWYWKWQYAPAAAAWVFIAASLTDWLDGYLARKLQLVTVFGAFMDPVADKIMVSTAMILLTTSPPPPLVAEHMVVPVALMICREVTMSALREWAAAAGGAAHKAVKVNSFGKWKTALQMFSMSLLLLCRQPLEVSTTTVYGVQIGVEQVVHVFYVMFWASSALAVWSLGIYMSNVWVHFVSPAVKVHTS